MGSIFKDQLLTELAFTHYCNTDPVGSGRRLNVTTEFIQASKKDGLIKPLLRLSEDVAGENGLTKQMVEYYSPHQLFLMVALRNNVLKDSRLDSPEPMAFGAQPMRTIMWGTAGYTVYAETGKPIGNLPQPNLTSIATKFHKFIKLLHSYPEADKYGAHQHNRGRLFNGAANARFDFDGVDELALKKAGLSIGDLKLLRQAVGSKATNIDPLEHWYYYLQKHSQVRKDVLKGDAGLAQELYLTENLIVDVIEKASGEKQPPLIEVLYQGGPRPFMMPAIEYAKGCDTVAIEKAIDKLRLWSTNKQNAKLLPPSFEERLKVIGDDLKDYVARYKGRGYLHNEPRQVRLEDWSLDELDEMSRAHVVADMKRWEQEMLLKKICATEIESERESERLYQIANAIWHRLSEIQGKFHLLAGEVREVIIAETDKAWREVHNPHGQLRDRATDQRLFKEAKAWEPINDSFNAAIEDASLIYCRDCRKERVQLHNVTGDRRLSTEPVCDSCFAKTADKALELTESEWSSRTGDELFCDYCVSPKGKPKLLYKFGQKNVVSLWSKSNAPIKVTLNYGLAFVEAKCPECGRIYQAAMDEGWGP